MRPAGRSKYGAVGMRSSLDKLGGGNRGGGCDIGGGGPDSPGGGIAALNPAIIESINFIIRTQNCYTWNEECTYSVHISTYQLRP